MKGLYLGILVITSLLLSSQLQSCKKCCRDASNPDCENYNPCLGKEATSADFVFEVKVNDKWYEVEDVYSGDYVRFSSKKSLESYKWYLGSEVLSDETFIRSGFPKNTLVECTLVGKKTADTECFPNDDGSDSIARMFKCWEYPDPQSGQYFKWEDTNQYKKEPLIGVYKGYKESNPNHVFEVTLSNFWLKYSGEIKRLGRIKGLPYENLEFYDGNFSQYYGFTPYVLKINYNGTIGGQNLWGIGGSGNMNKRDSSIVINFTHTDSIHYHNTGLTKRITDKFIGKKIR